MKILAVGDSYLPVEVFADGLAALNGDCDVEYLQLDPSEAFVPTTESELALREYEGAPRQLVERLDKVEVLAVHGAPVTQEVVEASARLRLVCCARGGPVNIDVSAASARGIPVVTTPGKNAEAVADQTMAFLIMLARRFPLAQRFLLEGGSIGESAFEGAEFFGNELGGHTLGLVGYGRVGCRVARRARAFGMTVLAYDPFVSLEANEPAEQVASLETLLTRSDFVSLHARATAETESLFGPTQFTRMRRGSYFINTSRETLVDEEALDVALASGHLAGAALDVVRPSATNGTHHLLRHDNVVITPHIGGATHETLQRGVSMLADEILRFRTGQPLLNVFNRRTVVT